MASYTITFQGRKTGAIGAFYKIHAEREAATPEAAIAALYDEYEHILQPRVQTAEERYESARDKLVGDAAAAIEMFDEDELERWAAESGAQPAA